MTVADRIPGLLITEGTYLVRVGGSLDEGAARKLGGVLSDVLDGEPDEVVVDLTEATFAHASAVEILMRAGQRAKGTGAVLTVACPDRNLSGVFRLVGATGALRLADGVGAAFAGVAARRRRAQQAA